MGELGIVLREEVLERVLRVRGAGHRLEQFATGEWSTREDIPSSGLTE